MRPFLYNLFTNYFLFLILWKFLYTKSKKNKHLRYGQDFYISNFWGAYIVNKQGKKLPLVQKGFEIKNSNKWIPHWVYFGDEEEPYCIIESEYWEKELYEKLTKMFIVETPTYELGFTILNNYRKTNSFLYYRYGYKVCRVAFCSEEQYKKFLDFSEKNKIYEWKIVELPFYYNSDVHYWELYKFWDIEKWEAYRSQIIDHYLFSEFVKSEKEKPFIL